MSTTKSLMTRSLWLLLVCTLIGSAKGDPPGTGSGSGPDYASPQLAHLESLVGVWTVTETHYNDLGQIVGTVKGTEEIGWILDKHALRRVYRTRTEATAYHAIGTLTWNRPENRFYGVWFDDVSTSGATLVSGTWSEKAGGLVLTLEAMADDGTMIEYRVIEKRADEDTRVATTFAIRKDEVIKRMTVKYKRSVPCPDKLRMVMPHAVGEGKLAPGDPPKKKGD